MKCLRCGIDLKDNSVFCPDCSKVTSVPLQSSAFLSRKIVLPKRKPSQSIKKPEGKNPTRKQRKAGGWILLSALLLLITSACVLLGAYAYDRSNRLAEEVARLHGFEDECVRLTDMLRQAEAEVASLEEELSGLGSASYLAIRKELKAVQAENDALMKELNRARADLAALESRMEQLMDKAELLDTHIVFLQDEDPTVFHSYNCEKFTRNSYRAYNKQLALSMGYTPCPQCQSSSGRDSS